MDPVRTATIVLLVCFVAPTSHCWGSASISPFTREYRTRLQRLCERHEWAREQRDRILDRCAFWMGQDDETLRKSIPSQLVPRALYCNRDAGCPECGREIFKHSYYPWRFDPVERPWKAQCPECKAVFPKNDFYAYYLSGLDDNDVFRPEQADKSLLFNTEHPDPDDPLHTYGVDPGTGYAEEGKGSFKFIANYNMHVNWGTSPYPHSGRSFPTGVADLGFAYASTGDPVYAKKAAVMLGRIADIYPELDFTYWAAKGGYHQYRDIGGKAVDSTWETLIVSKLALGYALIQDEIAGDAGLIARIEAGILREAHDKMKTMIIAGNTGLTEDAAIMMILATRDEAFRRQMTDWLFNYEEGEPIKGSSWRKTRPGLGLTRLIASLTADGFSWEGGSGYSAIFPLFLTRYYPALTRIAAASGDADLNTAIGLLKQRLPAFYRNSYDLVCLDRFTPNWGDGGAFAGAAIGKGAQRQNLLSAFAALDERDLGRMYLDRADMYTERDGADGDLEMPGDITAPYVDHEQLEPRLKEILDQKDPPSRRTRNMTGRGFVVLRSGAGDSQRALVSYYGSNSGHNHRETLNLYLFAHGLSLMPGLGYPNISNTAWRRGFWDNTISHNTVTVRGGPTPTRLTIGDQKLFVQSPLASLTEIDAPGVYTDLERYRRTSVMMNVSEDDFYIADFFQVHGGRDHIYSFHSGAGDVNVQGVKMTAQERGTYAGRDVPLAGDEGQGLQFFWDVERGEMTGTFSAEWNLQDIRNTSPFGDDVRLRLNLLAPTCEVAVAKSRPPQNVSGNPEYIHYVLARNTADENCASNYTAVIEAYLADQACVASVRKLQMAQADRFSSALEVTLADGRRDVFVKPGSENEVLAVEGQILFQGALMVARFDTDGKLSQVLACKPTRVKIGEHFETTCVPSLQAKVDQFTEGVDDEHVIVLDRVIDIPDDAIRPLWTDISPTAETADGNYRVEAVSRHDDRTVLSVGARAFVAGFDGETDEFIYAFERGAQVVLPLSYYWTCD